MGIPTKKIKNNDEIYNELGDAFHYDKERINNIHKMEAIWGTIALMYHCEITAFKYRDRIGAKPNQSLKTEIKKAEWYEKAAKYFYKKIQKNEAIVSITDDLPIEKRLPWKK